MSAPGTVIGGRYRLDSPIATGGMGTVWAAWDERLQRRVAVKQLRPQPGLNEAEARLAGERALREARITARLHHPHAVPVYDVVDHEGMPCLVMQFLEAKSLQALLAERGTLDIPTVARIGSEIASALEAAHRVGVVHRDVKPGNVLVDGEGVAKLTDFGISHARGDASLTSTGLVTGTPAYLAPEVARGAPSTAASDVFSLGSLLYTALEGTSPFGDGQNPMATLHRAASGQITPPRRSGTLTPLLHRILAVDPDQRPSMAEVAHALRDLYRHALDPATAATTRQLAAAPPPQLPPSGPPPSRTVMLPPAGSPVAPAPPERRRRTGLIAALVAIGLIVAGLAALLASQLGDGSGGDTAGGTATTPAAPVTRPSVTASQPAATEQPTQQPTEEATSEANQPPPTEQATSASASAGDPATAVTDYYSLLPDDTDTAWNLLTKHFQHSTARDRETYEEYWNSVEDVSVNNARTTGPESAEATINYVYDDGRTVAEDTAFDLKDERGVLKIDRTQILADS